MLELDKLTRCFHDQELEKIIINNNELILTISCMEVGDKYYNDGKYEARYYIEDSISIERRLNLKFYNVSDINSDFDLNLLESLSIDDLIIEDNKVTLPMYDILSFPSVPYTLSFNADGFDIEYIEK